MTGRIARTQVRFHLNDPAHGAPFRLVVHQVAAEEIPRNGTGAPGEERPREAPHGAG